MRYASTIAHAEKLPTKLLLLLDETVIPERPELFVAVTADRVEVQDRGILLPYIRPLRPVAGYAFWRHGQPLPLVEALPYLRAALGADWEFPQRSAG